MKKIPAYILFLGIALMSSLSSCLKDDSQPDFTQNQPIVELPVGSSSGNGSANSLATTLTVSATPSDYFVYVNYASPSANAADVAVTLGLNTDALTKYNTLNGTSYTLMPATAYVIPSLKVTIPSGQRKVQFPIKINTSVLDPSKTYALPLSITDASGFSISGNFGTLISLISLKVQ
jgi:hypothetical protein